MNEVVLKMTQKKEYARDYCERELKVPQFCNKTIKEQSIFILF